MSFNEFSSSSARPRGPGPFIAEVTNHLDITYMGGLEVVIIDDLAQPTVYDKSRTYPVRYLSPFYGVTSARFEGNNSGDFNDVQKSYGMWMVPPDVGTKVLVIFPEGAGQGYWIGCVPDLFQNHMVPGIASSQDVAMTNGQENKYGTRNLPVAEFNKKTNTGNNQNISKIPKPVHPFADRLVAQGLILDNIRGITSSSARREVPSMVFGISTPGPIDDSPGAPKGKIGYDGNTQFPISRLGGSTFVMDDGDVNGENELVRIRTRTGHQILLHNSADLVYIANAKGSAWIELTSNGKIDIYAQDSVSIHTQGDFNLRADRDFNLEAGRNFNIASRGDFNLNADQTANIIADTVKSITSGDFNISATGNLSMAANANINAAAGGDNKQSASGKFSIAGSTVAVGASGTLNVGASNIVASAGKIDLNGPAADSPAAPDTAQTPTPLNLFRNPQRNPGTGWENGNFYKGTDLISIMQRIPSHEPWDQHENINPSQFSLTNTDSSVTPTETAGNGAVIAGGASANTPYPAKNGPAGDRGTVKGEPFSWTTDQPFLDKVKSVASNLGFNPIDLLACMNLESDRTFDPAITNSLGFTGLIQFGVPAASSLGTSTSELRQMTRVGQMDYVEKYFHKLWGWPSAQCPNPTLVNIYLTILLPKFRFAPPDQKIADATDPTSSSWYKANQGFDPSPKKGYFTPAMVEATVIKHKNEVLQCLSKAGVGTDLVVPADKTSTSNPTVGK